MKIPAPRPLYKVRLRFKERFDILARDRITAARWLRELRRECGQLGLDLGSFFETYDRWKTKILNYFDARQTSAAVEGINNKARVITKRTYGLKSAKSLWDRLILDLNRASQAIGYSIEHIRQMAKGLKALFQASPSTRGNMANLLGPSRTRRRSKSSLRRTSASFAAPVPSPLIRTPVGRHGPQPSSSFRKSADPPCPETRKALLPRADRRGKPAI